MLIELKIPNNLSLFSVQRQQIRFRTTEKLPRQIAVIRAPLIVRGKKLRKLAEHEAVREYVPADARLPPIKTLAARLALDLQIDDRLMTAAVSRPSWANLDPERLSSLQSSLSLPSTSGSALATQSSSKDVNEPSSSDLTQSDSRLASSELEPIALNMSDVKDNASLAVFGDSLLRMFAYEHLYRLYPQLPSAALRDAVESRVGDLTCAKISLEWGANYHARWRPTPVVKDESKPIKQAKTEKLTEQDRAEEACALASIPRAIAAIIYKQVGPSAANEFIKLHFFTERQVDMREILRFSLPKPELRYMCKAFGRQPPTFRMLAESGRFSKSPIYIVGAHSGEVKLGEGYGISIRMAEHRAATNALHNLYLSKSSSPQDIIE